MIACVLAGTWLAGVAAAQSVGPSGSPATPAATNAAVSKNEADAIKHVNDAVAVVRRMESEAGMAALLQQAKGVFIMPRYARAALGVGASGGPGVLLVKNDDGTWSDPAFYHVGGISVGLQAGVEAGPIAMVLNNAKAVSKFMQKNNFSLNADAGLTVVNWAKIGSLGKGDVVFWAGSKGLFGNVATLGLNDIRYSQSETDAYYRQGVAPGDVTSGKVKNPQADALKAALAASSTATTSGSSGASPSGSTRGGTSEMGSGKSDASK